jgi:hypothetical protein
MSDSAINPQGFVEQDAPPANPKPPVPNDPLERMLWYLTYSVDEAPQVEPESIVQKALAVGTIHQAIALERIADALDRLGAGHLSQPPIIAIESGEWRDRLVRLAPTAPEYVLRDPATARHAYRAAEGSIVCNECGGGYLHVIHQV